MKKLAIAIPTYNRNKDIDYFLKTEFFLSEKYFVDILIFDSSEKDYTSKCVDDYKNNGFSNLIYYHIDSSVQSNEKLFNIYEQLTESYRYIWVLHDHTVFNEKSFDFLSYNLVEDVDFYFLKTQCKDYKIHRYENLNKFFYDSAWLLGKMGASVVNSKSFLKNINWKYYRDKYLTKNKINFSHIGLYFERAAEMAKFNAVTIEFPRDSFVDTHRYEKLSWEKDSVRICTQCWCEVINALPKDYTNKNDTIKTIDSYFLTKYKLIEYKEKGSFGFITFLKYKKWMKISFPELYKDALKIAVYPLLYVKRKYSKKILEDIYKANSESREIYIYGAGKHGLECLDFLEYCGAEIDGFLVTDIKGNPDKIRKYPVKELADVANEKKIFAMIAVMDKLQKEIETLIVKYNENGKDIKWCRF